ncbi:hypothetical protein LWX53_10775, partial [bacterium]|nr:hypothetical protein [bacterium]
MSDRLARNWSVQLKLSLLYQLLATAAFLAFAFILYQHFDRSLRSDFDAYLESKADGIEESIHTYWAAEGLKLPDPAAKGPPAGKRADSAEFERIARSWADDQGETPPFLMVAVRIFSPNGAIIVASPRIESGIGLSQETLARASAGDSRFETIQIQVKNGARLSFRMYTRPVKFGDSIVYFIQVVSSLKR